MTPEEIVTADDAGHLDDLMAGRDPDAKVDHRRWCSQPELERVPVLGSIRIGDPIHYRCPECAATTHITTEES
jgi:hypothetical protein